MGALTREGAFNDAQSARGPRWNVIVPRLFKRFTSAITTATTAGGVGTGSRFSKAIVEPTRTSFLFFLIRRYSLEETVVVTLEFVSVSAPKSEKTRGLKVAKVGLLL